MSKLSSFSQGRPKMMFASESEVLRTTKILVITTPLRRVIDSVAY
jgi:hypothetical protein